MFDNAIADALSDPAALLQLVALLMVLLTIIVAALTSVVTVHLVLRRREVAPDAAAPALMLSPRMIPAQMIPAQMIPAQIVAVISAAAYAVVGSHRLIHIGEWPHGSSWTAEARQHLHVSHSPHA